MAIISPDHAPKPPMNTLNVDPASILHKQNISVDRYEKGYFYNFDELYEFFRNIPIEIISRLLLPELFLLNSLISSFQHFEES